MKIRLSLLLALVCSFAFAQNPGVSTTAPQQTFPTVKEKVEVTATRLPEDPLKVPAAVEVFTAEELAARGATDLRSAMAFATGVEIAPGGDAGPASNVPAFWGLKEFDAFLLVVDGVPWGGTFNPALTSLSLADIDRIEVLRGPAPVMYGATSFVGVIQVVHKSTESKDRTLEVRGGSFATGGGAFSTPIPLGGDWSSRLTVEGERVGFSDEREAYRRGHGLYRISRKPSDGNRVWLNFDMNWLDQDPASPRPRDGKVLSPDVPVDSNQNMAGAFLNDHRGTVMGGFDNHGFAGSEWSTTASVSHSRQDAFRGFLVDLTPGAADNAHGFREKINFTDVYADSHLSWKLPRSVRVLVGGDYLHGTGTARGADFDYTTLLTGAAAVVPSPADLDFHINDHRDFFGAYTSLEWSPFERMRIDGGVRLNITREHQQVIDGGEGTSVEDTLTKVRPGANVGAIYTLWQGNNDSLGAYVNYRNTYKPAAIDFGIGESEGGPLILQPETSNSVEGGLKGRFLNRRLEWEASGFLMNFSNLVTATNVGGVPALINSGKQRFQGFESEASMYLSHDVVAHATYAFHDSTFRDFVRDFDGVATQLAGKRLEMSPNHLAAVGLAYAPTRGFTGSVEVNYTGMVFLNMRNTAPHDGFATVGAGIGYRTPGWELRVDARNLGDRRDPVAESEFGDAQYYLLPARRVDASFKVHF